jgi:hypothetical protein
LACGSFTEYTCHFREPLVTQLCHPQASRQRCYVVTRRPKASRPRRQWKKSLLQWLMPLHYSNSRFEWHIACLYTLCRAYHCILLFLDLENGKMRPLPAFLTSQARTQVIYFSKDVSVRISRYISLSPANVMVYMQILCR